MPVTISPNMGLIIPVVGPNGEPGPAWANDTNADWGILDQHNHSTGQGVPITPSGLNINSDLSINSNNLTAVKTVNFTSQLAPLAGLPPNLGAVYVAGNELYYNDEAGNVVQITNGGSVNAGAGSITGLPSGTASASYSAGSKTFIWQSATSTAANMDGGSFIFREVVASAKGVTVSSPTSLAADYQLFWPAALPGVTTFLTVDTGGNMGDSYVLDNSTLEVSSNVIQVKDHGITQAKLALKTTGSTVAAGGIAFQDSGLVNIAALTYTDAGFSIILTTTGRPVQVCFQPIPGGTQGQMYLATSSTSLSNMDSNLQILNNATPVVIFNPFFDGMVTGGTPQNTLLPGGFNFLDMSVNGTPGTYTYTVEVKNNNAPQTFVINQIRFLAYEI